MRLNSGICLAFAECTAFIDIFVGQNRLRNEMCGTLCWLVRAGWCLGLWVACCRVGRGLCGGCGESEREHVSSWRGETRNLALCWQDALQRSLQQRCMGRVGASDFLSASAMIPTDARPRRQDAAHRCRSCRWVNWLRSFALLAISKIIINQFYSLFGCVMTAFY